MKKRRHHKKSSVARLLRHTRNGADHEFEKFIHRTRKEQSFTEAESINKAKYEHIQQGG